MNKVQNKVHIELSASPIKFEKINDQFTKLTCYIMGLGKNRNGSFFSEQATNKAVSESLYYTPVVAHIMYDEANDKHYVGGHDIEFDDEGNLKDSTLAYGVVMENSACYKDVEEYTGKIVKYLIADIILWTGRFPEIEFAKYDDNLWFNQSMEVIPEKSEALTSDKNYRNITDFTFSCLTLLGYDEDKDSEYHTEPCFPNAQVVSAFCKTEQFQNDFNKVRNSIEEFMNKYSEISPSVGEDTNKFLQKGEKNLRKTNKKPEAEVENQEVFSDETTETEVEVDTEDCAKKRCEADESEVLENAVEVKVDVDEDKKKDEDEDEKDKDPDSDEHPDEHPDNDEDDDDKKEKPKFELNLMEKLDEINLQICDYETYQDEYGYTWSRYFLVDIQEDEAIVRDTKDSFNLYGIKIIENGDAISLDFLNPVRKKTKYEDLVDTSEVVEGISFKKSLDKVFAQVASEKSALEEKVSAYELAEKEAQKKEFDAQKEKLFSLLDESLTGMEEYEKIKQESDSYNDFEKLSDTCYALMGKQIVLKQKDQFAFATPKKDKEANRFGFVGTNYEVANKDPYASVMQKYNK